MVEPAVEADCYFFLNFNFFSIFIQFLFKMVRGGKGEGTYTSAIAG